MANSFLKDMKKLSKNDFSSIVDDGILGGDVKQWLDTGSYAFNALLSGSIHKGLPANKITAIAGAESTGKTLFVLSIMSHFLQQKKDGVVVFFESESAITKDMMRSHGIDLSRVLMLPVATVEQFQHQATVMLNDYNERDEKPPMLFVLDSLGNLSTKFELEGALSDDPKADAGRRAKLCKGVFRVLTLKMGISDVPLIVTNHVYDSIGSYFPMKVMGGGSGLKFTASQIVVLSKKKIKDGTEVVGNEVTCQLSKARFGRENNRISAKILYDSGLDKYYGLLPIAEKAGIFKKVSKQYVVSDGSKVFESKINKNPEKYFTEDVLNQIEAYVKENFVYGSIAELDEEEDEPGK